LPIACAVIGLGVAVLAQGAFGVACGVLGPLAGVGYLVAPAWRFRVEVDDQALAVWHGRNLRFRLPWDEVKQVIHSPSTATCFVDGGRPERSLLVPGPGAPGPYRIERREALVARIVARVPRERRREVERLDAGVPEGPPP
jgi:hypothetical protein